MKKTEWLPKAKPPKLTKEEGKTVRSIREGEPSLIDLERYEGDNFVMGDRVDVCCDCGLAHHRVFSVRKRGARFELEIRSWRL